MSSTPQPPNGHWPPPLAGERGGGVDPRLARLQARSLHHREQIAARPAPRPTAGRAHPARGARHVALGLSIGATATMAALMWESAHGSAAGTETLVVSVPASTVPATASTAVTTVPATAAPTSETTTATVPATAAFADGTYTGQTVSTRWGPVQVQVQVAGGTIAAVDVLQYPTDDHKSVAINQRAIPVLVQATLTSQSADVDTVSGATYTSDGYQQSLQTALDEAQAAAVG